MKSLRIIFSVLLTQSSLLTFAQTNSNVTKPGLLWEVSGKGLKQPSYLFGTYHLVGKNYLDTLPGIMARFNQAKSVVGEVIMEDEMAMAQKLMPMMLLKESSLDKILSAKEFAEADSFVKVKTSMSLAMLNGMKPSAVQLMLIAMMAPKNVSPENPALDMFFQTEGKKANKSVAGLETLNEQGDMLFNSDINRQKELLLKTIRESDRMIKESVVLFDQYKNQDLKAIEKAFLENEDYTATEMDMMLSKRNKNWIIKMPAMMNAGPVFFAIGAGHLIGPDGLIALLKKEGYKVAPLSLK